MNNLSRSQRLLLLLVPVLCTVLAILLLTTESFAQRLVIQVLAGVLLGVAVIDVIVLIVLSFQATRRE